MIKGRLKKIKGKFGGVKSRKKLTAGKKSVKLKPKMKKAAKPRKKHLRVLKTSSPSMHLDSKYNEAFDQAYDEGFNDGFAQGYKLEQEQQVV